MLSGAILVYDVTKTSSFQKLETWLEELEINTNSDITKMIVGNKIDLPNRTVDREMGKKFAKQKRALYVETSCLTNINVHKSFEELVRKILEDGTFENQMERNDIRLSRSESYDTGRPTGSCGGYCGR